MSVSIGIHPATGDRTCFALQHTFFCFTCFASEAVHQQKMFLFFFFFFFKFPHPHLLLSLPSLPPTLLSPSLSSLWADSQLTMFVMVTGSEATGPATCTSWLSGNAWQRCACALFACLCLCVCVCVSVSTQTGPGCTKLSAWIRFKHTAMLPTATGLHFMVMRRGLGNRLLSLSLFSPSRFLSLSFPLCFSLSYTGLSSTSCCPSHSLLIFFKAFA